MTCGHCGESITVQMQGLCAACYQATLPFWQQERIKRLETEREIEILEYYWNAGTATHGR